MIQTKKEKRKSQDRKRKGYKAWKWECQSKYESTRWNGDKYKRIHLKRGENPKIKGDRGYFISGFRLETGSLERSTGT